MKKTPIILSTLIVVVFACSPEPRAIYDPTMATVNLRDFPNPEFPADNPLSNAGILLGRMLFYEKLLSKDGTQACADCHRQPDGFSDSLQFSIGVEKMNGKRQAMPLINLAWHKNGLFWDGRAPLVRDQALKPIQDPLEMNETLANVIQKLSTEKKYTDQFIRAFGDPLITEDRIGRAIEQFEFILISNNSKYDRYKRGETTLTNSEERGRSLFFTEFDPNGIKKGAECFHCHATFNFTNNEYMNNGLDSETEQKDFGRMDVTLDPSDKAKFKTPTLRNIAQTAPYMHDGRFKTLEAVIDHYNIGVKNSPTVDFLMQYNLQLGGLNLNAQDKSDLIAFLKTLSDDDYLTNPAFKTPF